MRNGNEPRKTGKTPKEVVRESRGGHSPRKRNGQVDPKEIVRDLPKGSAPAAPPRRVAMTAKAKHSLLAAVVDEVLGEAHASTYMRHDIGDPKLRAAFVASLVDGVFMPALKKIEQKYKPL